GAGGGEVCASGNLRFSKWGWFSRTMSGAASVEEEAQRIAVIVILCLFNIFFWMGFEQAGGTMTLFADSQTQRNVAWVGVFAVAATTLGAAVLVWYTTRGQPGTKGFWFAVTLSSSQRVSSTSERGFWRS
ncbi:MAG: hypothetical protein WCI05_17380, partial [Myxococcales bacterium]